jgi:hypothetical protein
MVYLSPDTHFIHKRLDTGCHGALRRLKFAYLFLGEIYWFVAKTFLFGSHKKILHL